MSIARHKTAMYRTELSRPIRTALEDGLINSTRELLDYGCGHGGDVMRLGKNRVSTTGWDPVFFPNQRKAPAAVVNLGYVVNVIEDTRERNNALKKAWNLSKSLLIVSARLVAEAKSNEGSLFGDGFVSTAGTFQKFYTQQELRDWIDETLKVQCIAAAPGVFYVFRDPIERERFVVSRFRGRTKVPRVRFSDMVFERNRKLFEPLIKFYINRGRLPRAEEYPSYHKLREEVGTIRQSFQIIRRVMDTKDWEEIGLVRSEDILIYLALSRFDRRPRFSELPREVQLDVRAFFSSYKRACYLSDVVLQSLRNQQAIHDQCAESPVGKLTPTALYVHESALGDIPPLLRIYEGCARLYAGTIADANIVKLHRRKPKVSYLTYPAFDGEAHPELKRSLLVHLGKQDIELRTYHDAKNPPVLHRKETFLASSHPSFDEFSKLTSQEESLGLLAEPARIGTKKGWEACLLEKGALIEGHEVVSA